MELSHSRQHAIPVSAPKLRDSPSPPAFWIGCCTVWDHTIAPLSLEWLHFFLLSAANSEVRSPYPLSLYPVSRLMDYSIIISLKIKQIKILKISLFPRWNLGMVKLWNSANFHIICYVVLILRRADLWIETSNLNKSPGTIREAIEVKRTKELEWY